jgi:hypothetical protein
MVSTRPEPGGDEIETNHRRHRRASSDLDYGSMPVARPLRNFYHYQSPQDTEQIWINGWFPSASLAAVAPLRAPRTADWMGTWSHPGGEIRIEAGDAGSPPRPLQCQPPSVLRPGPSTVPRSSAHRPELAVALLGRISSPA